MISYNPTGTWPIAGGPRLLVALYIPITPSPTPDPGYDVVASVLGMMVVQDTLGCVASVQMASFDVVFSRLGTEMLPDTAGSTAVLALEGMTVAGFGEEE